MSTSLNPKKTALLLLDLQNGFLQRLSPDISASVVDNAASAISFGRKNGIQVAYVRAALDESELQEIPDHNPVFAVFKNNKEMSAAIHPDGESTQIHPKLTPQPGDFVHRKTRFGSFMKAPSNAMLKDFASHGIDTIIIGGVVTSGAVLSAVRQLADLDFQLFVLEDCCADHDLELHKVLCEKVFLSQAKVIGSKELETLF